MNKRELAKQLAKQLHTSRAKAADDVDSLVYGLLKDMKQSQKQSAKSAGKYGARTAALQQRERQQMSDLVKGQALNDLITRCLREGTPIEIDGLGKFDLQNDEVVFKPSERIRVFLAYAEEDRAVVRKLYKELEQAGFEPWMDVEKLMPGQNWPRAIERAIDVTDFILVNFSHRSVDKRGHFQCELRHALDVADRVPLSDIFLVPVRLSDCEVPAEIARVTQYLDLFPDYEIGIKALTSMMTAQMLKKRKKVIRPKRRIL